MGCIYVHFKFANPQDNLASQQRRFLKDALIIVSLSRLPAIYFCSYTITAGDGEVMIGTADVDRLRPGMLVWEQYGPGMHLTSSIDRHTRR